MVLDNVETEPGGSTGKGYCPNFTPENGQLAVPVAIGRRNEVREAAIRLSLIGIARQFRLSFASIVAHCVVVVASTSTTLGLRTRALKPARSRAALAGWQAQSSDAREVHAAQMGLSSRFGKHVPTWNLDSLTCCAALFRDSLAEMVGERKKAGMTNDGADDS